MRFFSSQAVFAAIILLLAVVSANAAEFRSYVTNYGSDGSDLNDDRNNADFNDWRLKKFKDLEAGLSSYKYQFDSKKNKDLEVEGEAVSSPVLDAERNDIVPSTSTAKPKNDSSKKKSTFEPTTSQNRPSVTVTFTPQKDSERKEDQEVPVPPSVEEQIRLLNLNNPEYRMMGPNRNQEVLMGDDLGSRLVAALDNMKEEAKEVWGKVSDTVDDQWGQLKKMFDQQLKQIQQKSEDSYKGSRKLQSSELMIPSDGPVNADLNPANVAGDKGFLNQIGINDDTQKKAGEFFSNAGTSIKDVAQKDIPDAYEKAKSAVSETVTKDIPNYWNKLFGNNSN